MVARAGRQTCEALRPGADSIPVASTLHHACKERGIFCRSAKRGAVSVKQPIVGADAYGMPDQVADSFKLKASPDSLLSSGVIQCSGGVTRQPRMSFAQMIPDMVTDSRPAPGKVDAPAKYSPLIGARK